MLGPVPESGGWQINYQKKKVGETINSPTVFIFSYFFQFLFTDLYKGLKDKCLKFLNY